MTNQIAGVLPMPSLLQHSQFPKPAFEQSHTSAEGLPLSEQRVRERVPITRCTVQPPRERELCLYALRASAEASPRNHQQQSIDCFLGAKVWLGDRRGRILAGRFSHGSRATHVGAHRTLEQLYSSRNLPQDLTSFQDQ